MWNRKELKLNAKQLLKANYWKAVIVGLILSILYGSFAISSRNTATGSDLTDQITALDDKTFIAVVAVIFGVLAIVMVIDLLLTIFLWNPIEVGCQKFYINCKSGEAKLDDIIYSFKNGYGHIGVVMLCRTIFTILWLILLIIPGIIKAYEYMMIPFILAEEPDISRKDAFAKSKAMMHGNKWNAFVLDLSFLGWLILGGITLGILNIFFVNPYMYLSHAELYHALKNNNGIKAGAAYDGEMSL